MALRTRPSIDPPPVFAPFPGWARMRATPEAIGEASFFAGAALAALHPIARDEHVLGKLWRQRLALTAAAHLARQAGRTQDEAALRDAFYLRRTGDDPGPAGKILMAWRKLGEPAALNCGEWPPLLAGMFGLRIDRALEELMVIAARLATGEGSPMAAVSQIAATSRQLRPDCEMLALWLADAILAARLKWPAPIPLLAGPFLSRKALNSASSAGHDAGTWILTCCQAYARAAVQAADLHAGLCRRAQILLSIAPKLRGRDAGDRIALLLSEDALAAASSKTTSERSARRLFDRLEASGAIRELTGRSSFRLYGL